MPRNGAAAGVQPRDIQQVERCRAVDWLHKRHRKPRPMNRIGLNRGERQLKRDVSRDIDPYLGSLRCRVVSAPPEPVCVADSLMDRSVQDLEVTGAVTDGRSDRHPLARASTGPVLRTALEYVAGTSNLLYGAPKLRRQTSDPLTTAV